MPHQIAGRRLGRASDHRMHMLANLAVSVLRYEKVRITEAKDKEVRGIVDRLTTLGKCDEPSARRLLVAVLPHQPHIVDKLSGELSATFAGRASGHTRI